MEIIEKILDEKIIVIARKIYDEQLLRFAEAMINGGLHLLEVTFDQSDGNCIDKTTRSIQMLKNEFKEEMNLGAGTVLTTDQVKAAKDAGCEYIISPNTNMNVIQMTKELGMISIPGAMTPSEIIAANEYGADFVKLFPASYLGTDYIKGIKGPINHVKLIATGGISKDNFAEFLKAGVVGAGIGGSLTDRKCIEQGNFEELTRRARELKNIAEEN